MCKAYCLQPYLSLRSQKGHSNRCKTLPLIFFLWWRINFNFPLPLLWSFRISRFNGLFEHHVVLRYHVVHPLVNLVLQFPPFQISICIFSACSDSNPVYKVRKSVSPFYLHCSCHNFLLLCGQFLEDQLFQKIKINSEGGVLSSKKVHSPSSAVRGALVDGISQVSDECTSYFNRCW